MSEKKKKKDPYKATLNLPKTSFSMRANLLQNEPQHQKRWDRMGLYQMMRETEHPKGTYTFHDGPPYANGSIHLGHLLNKVLKDIVVRSRFMDGFDVPFVPGWDCHGLPIEHKVMKELGDKAREMEPIQIRRRCKTYAQKFVKLQAKQMQNLGTVGDYDNPYITMNPAYEGAVLELFAELVDQGLVYRALRPVHWSIANRTALAEAELEYQDREDISIYVNFAVTDVSALPDSLNAPDDAVVHLMIWTTTPWTLPANLAVAVSGSETYGLYSYQSKDGATEFTVLGEELAEQVLAKGGATQVTNLGTCKGVELADARLTYQHPFVNRTGPVVMADYVTMTDGTGLVHTAPGHGAEDYQTGKREGLDIYCPVRSDGTYDDTVPEWLQGKNIWDANSEVVEHLRKTGPLFFDHVFSHSYPHDWRSKTPTIFRATEQWFIGVDHPMKRDGKSLRDSALNATANEIRFIPEWGQNRLRGMLESRPDWCISRQRSWGLPIPAFHHTATQEVLLTPASVQAVAKLIREKGSDVWFLADAATLLTHYDPSTDADAPACIKEGGKEALADLEVGRDIFDVWFESGTSWHAVLRQRGLGYPAALYLEGSDQHRGWFQLSLLPGLGATGHSPFDAVLTHGFMVDADGRKMSKSLGNTIEVEDLLKELGADVCRWWVCSLNYTNDIKVDWKFFGVAAEEYRKVRNTIRFFLGNLNDYDNSKDRRELTDADKHTLDAWAYQKLSEMVNTVKEGYEQFQFRKVNKAIFDFCNDTMSAIYLAACKDRLYCDATDSDRRRRTQTVLFDTVSALIKLVAPVLVHTADEAYLSLTGETLKESKNSVHLGLFPEVPVVEADANWDTLFELRAETSKKLEEAKASMGINYPLDAGVEAVMSASAIETLQPYFDDIVDFLGVSRFSFVEGENTEVRIVDLQEEPRCARSWLRNETVKERSNGDLLSDRDADVVGV